MNADSASLVDILPHIQLTALKSKLLDSDQSHYAITLDGANLKEFWTYDFLLNKHSLQTQIFQTANGPHSNSLRCSAATVMLQTLTGQAHETRTLSFTALGLPAVTFLVQTFATVILSLQT